MRELPTGTVTFLFTDIEGSTRLLEELGEGYADVLAEHHRLIREAVEHHAGVEVDTAGDAFFVVFERPADAVAAAAAAQEALAPTGLRVRMGIHTGEALLTETGYIGMDVHQGARVMSAGHGGQVLVSDATRTLLDGDRELADLGLHRLKDLTEPQRLWQLGEREFPPLKTLYQTNLPVQPTPLVGRERELRDVLELVRGERLVTLTGAGGSGKTRLALQAAAELTDEFKDGVWWVSLAALRDRELVDPTIAQVVGAKDDLSEFLRPKRMLLLLDNFEQVVEAAPVVSDLLAAALELRVLVTSRERLALAGEHEYVVPPMEAAEAVALFTARATQVKRDFAADDAVVEICRRLDGLPLAVELAAARIKLLTPTQILERLGRSLDLLTAGSRDAPERHHTLRRTIEWSYDLLGEEEKRLFARLAVFAGSFSLEAAEAVCGADVHTLAALVDKSLLRQTGDGRFFFHETIREYGGERLSELPEAEETKDRHAVVVRGIVEAAASDASVSEVFASRIDADAANIRAALAWACERDAELALRLAAPLGSYWDLRGLFEEGQRWLRAAARRAGNRWPGLQAQCLVLAAHLAQRAGEYSAAAALLRDARPLAAAAGDDEALAELANVSGIISGLTGDSAAAAASFEEAAALDRRHGGERLAATVANLARALLEIGELSRAERAAEEGLELGRAAGSHITCSFSLSVLGRIAVARRDLPGAREYLRQALENAAAIEHPWHIAECLEERAFLAIATGDYRPGGRLWGAAEAVRERIGAPLGPSEHSRHEHAMQKIGEAARRTFARGVEEGRSMPDEAAVAYALSID